MPHLAILHSAADLLADVWPVNDTLTAAMFSNLSEYHPFLYREDL